MLCCHHPASEMLGMLIKTRKLHPIVTKTDYNCFMYYRHRLQANIKGWTTEIFHEDCLQIRVHDHRSLLFVSSGAVPKCANMSTRRTPVRFKFYRPLLLFRKMWVRIMLLFIYPTIVHQIWIELIFFEEVDDPFGVWQPHPKSGRFWLG